MKNLYRVLSVLLALVFVASACAPAAAPTPAAPTAEPGEPAPTTAPSEPADKVLKLHLYEDIQNVDPAFFPSDADESVMANVYEGLVAYKPGTWELENVLAESITPSDDGLTIEFKLKEGVQFHGGFGELTAEDVKFSFERIADPEMQAVYAGDWAALDHVEVTGTYTGKIVLKEPFAALWTQTLPLTSGWILSKKANDERGAKAFATHPIGTGPYEFVEWKPNDHVTLQRFEDYWGEQPEFGTIIHQYIPQESSVDIALETGEIDFGRVSPASVERFEANSKFKVVAVPSLDVEILCLNTQHPKLADVKVRQAIRYAIDLEAINEAVYEGRYAPLTGMLMPGQVGYWEDGPIYKRDVDKAKELMGQAGVQSLDLTLAIQNTEAEKAVGEIIQANLADIGINLTLDIQDDAAFVDGGFGDKGLQERQLVYLNWIGYPDPSGESYWWTCEQVKQWNWAYWCNERYDELHAAALKELGEERRQEMYVEMQQIMDEEVPVIWVSQIVLYYVTRADLVPSIMPHGRVLGWNFASQQ